MRAMVLTAPCVPLQFPERVDPVPGLGAVPIRVSARGVCRTDLAVTNLTRNDGIELFDIAGQAGIKTHTTAFPLRAANEVLSKLPSGQITGAVVLQP